MYLTDLCYFRFPLLSSFLLRDGVKQQKNLGNGYLGQG